MIKLQRDLHEQIYRAIMVKGKHGWIDKGMLFSTLALGAISISSIDVHADIWNYYDSTQSITKYLKYSTENKGLFFKTGSGLQLKNGRKEERLGDWVKINMNYFDFDDIAKNSTRSFDNTQLLEDIENTTIEIVENGLSMFDLDNQEENDTNISTSYISELSDDDK